MRTVSRREFALGVAASAAAAAMGSAAWPAERGDVDPMSLVDPALRAELKKMLPDLEKERFTTATLAQMRTLSESYADMPDPTPAYTVHTMPGAAGRPTLKVYVINARAARGRPAILHIHGGGYVVGRAIDSVKRLQKIAMTHDCLVVSVDYRLAPEARFPAALEDNYAALQWLYDHADDLGVDRRRIAVMGESAGGGHAAALAIAARDRGDIALCLQVLVYPMLDDRTGSTRQPPPWIGTYVWKRDSNVFGWSSLLGKPAGSEQVPHGAVPARVDHLAGLAPAFIGVGSIDLFVEEDVDFARRLVAGGVPTELYVAPGAYHGFNEIVPAAPVSMMFENVLNAAIQRGFESDHA